MGFIFASSVVAGLLVFQFAARYVCTYRISADEVQVVLFRFIPIHGVALVNIMDISEVPYTRSLWPNFSASRFGNRIFGRVVAIQKKSGMLATVFITPDDPEEFVAEVKSRIQGRTNPPPA